jgi:cytochrome P450
VSSLADSKLDRSLVQSTKRTLLANVPLSPPAAEELYFSSDDNAWIVSRYRDVLSAFRSPVLSQVRPQRAGDSDSSKPVQSIERLELAVACSAGLKSTQIKDHASNRLKGLRIQTVVDLVGEFIWPWCVDAAFATADIHLKHRQYLTELLTDLAARDGAPYDSDLKNRAREANRSLDLFFQTTKSSSLKSLFLGVAQTLPIFVASAWAALVQHPDQMRQLTRHPDQIPKAIEELLRYAGPVHTVFRQAETDLELSGAFIARGDRLILRVASANRDAKKFVDPDRLDITRESTGHLALAAGIHSCPGAARVRTLTASATLALLEHFSSVELSGRIAWSCGSMLIWPSSLPVLLSVSE